MKKLICAALIISLMLSVCGCTIVDTGTLPVSSGETPTEAPKAEAGAAVVNPFEETTAEGLMNDMGLDFSILEGYENAKFFKINGNPIVASISFDFNGDSYNYRAAAAADECDISGMYYEWTTQESVEVGYCTAALCLTAEGQGCISWFDAAPGVEYCLSMSENADSQKLTALANILFVPTQGDAEGDLEVVYAGIMGEICTAYFPGTAGSSIIGAVCAAKLADLLSQYGSTADAAAAAVKCCRALSAEDKTVFFSQLSGVKGSFYSMCENGTGILSDGGYTPAEQWDQAALKTAFDAIVEAVSDAPYASILEQYYTVVEQDWSMEALIENNINMMLGYVEGTDEIGYALIDLDGDGVKELLIGAVSEDDFLRNIVYDLFTLDELGEAVNVFSSQERSRYYYAGGDCFNYHGSGGAADSEDNVQRYAAGEMTVTGTRGGETVSIELTPFSALK